MENLLKRWKFTPGTHRVSLQEAEGKVSAEDVFSRNTLPVCRAAGADGVAVRYADFENGLPDFSDWKENEDYGTADMGDDFDDAFDTVLWVEDFTFDENGKILDIRPEEPVKKGQLVKKKGDTVREGEQILKKGDAITPFRLGLLAAAGIHDLLVLESPKIAYLPTGSELIPAGQMPKRGENIESNSLMTAAFCRRWGAAPQCFPIVEDQKSSLEEALNHALKTADIVLLNGGTSMEMYVRLALVKKGNEYLAEPLPMNVRFAEAAKRWNGWFIAPIGMGKWEAGSEIEAEVLYTDC